MVAYMSTYGKILLKILYQNQKADDLGTQYCRPYQDCINDDPSLTLTYFTTRSNLIPNAFYMGKILKKKSFFYNC